MFGERLKLLRTENKMSQTDLGKLLNKTKNNISQYENVKRNPDIETLNKIAELFDVTTDYLLGRSDFKKGRLIAKEELITFIPESTIEENTLEFWVDDAELKEETKMEIKHVLKEHGYLK